MGRGIPKFKTLGDEKAQTFLVTIPITWLDDEIVDEDQYRQDLIDFCEMITEDMGFTMNEFPFPTTKRKKNCSVDNDEAEIGTIQKGWWYSLVAEDTEGDNVAIGVVPNLNADDVEEDIWDEHGNKEDWYERRGLDFEDRIEKLIDHEWEKILDRQNRLERKLMKVLSKPKYKEYDVHIRTGNYTSTKLKKNLDYGK